MVNIREYKDGGFIPKDNTELSTFMEEAGLLSDKVPGKIAFCGAICLENTLHIFMPKTFLGHRGERDNAKLLVSCIRQYAHNRGKTLSIDDSPSAKIRGTSPLLAIDILEDYLKSGLYRNSEPEIKRRQGGKIAWSLVIKKFLPHLREDGTPVYPELLVRRINYFSPNEVTDIHAAIVATLDPLFSWYLDKDEPGVAPELSGSRLKYSTEKSVALLKKELASVFSDREMHLLKNLIAFLENITISPQENRIVTGITDFEHVWENMCAHLYKNQLDKLSGHIPVPAYIYPDGRKERYSSNRSRMDIFIEEGSEVAVLDAKYYDFKATMPSWPDLVKQFYYAQMLSAILPGKKIKNLFVVPAPEVVERPEKVVVLDKNDKIMGDPFGKIGIIYLEVRGVMQDYISDSVPSTYRDGVFGIPVEVAA